MKLDHNEVKDQREVKHVEETGELTEVKKQQTRFLIILYNSWIPIREREFMTSNEEELKEKKLWYYI